MAQAFLAAEVSSSADHSSGELPAVAVMYGPSVLRPLIGQDHSAESSHWPNVTTLSRLASDSDKLTHSNTFSYQPFISYVMYEGERISYHRGEMKYEDGQTRLNIVKSLEL